MTAAPKRSFTLELDSDAPPMTGRVIEGERGSVDFVGWLGLASALERLIEERADVPPAAGAPDPGR